MRAPLLPEKSLLVRNWKPVFPPPMEWLRDKKGELVDKQKIIRQFRDHVKGVEIDTRGQHTKHCGKEGFWLESKMGFIHTSKNEPDIYGYEMKKNSKKITLGDFSASEYVFSIGEKREFINRHNHWTDDIYMSRSQFIKTFGNPNSKKNGRYAWSGSCVPKYNVWNSNGQILTVNEQNDICILYSFSKDTRSEKETFPLFLHMDDILIAVWTSSKMKNHIDQKFNKRGFFICKKNGRTSDKICFGKPFDFLYFIQCIKLNKIIFDSGMYDGNNRNYSQFRGTDTNFWSNLLIEEYV